MSSGKPEGGEGTGSPSEDPTVIEAAVARGRTRTVASTSSIVDTRTESSLVGSAALKSERVRQAQAGLRAVIFGASSGVILNQFAQVRPPTHHFVTAALVLTLVTAIVLYTIQRGKGESLKATPIVMGVALSLLILTVIGNIGILSWAVMLMPLVAYYYAASDLEQSGRIVLGLCAGGYLVVVALTTTGVIVPSETVLALAREDVNEMWANAAFVEGIIGLTYMLGRAVRRATRGAMDQLEQARRQILQREALLNEARADFDRVVDAGRFGRFTRTMIGPYDIGDVIGRGGMGEIYEAVHAESAQAVAIKVLHPHMISEEDHVQRFFREAQITGSLASPHVVRTLESGHATDGSPYLVMELLQGRDLAELLREKKRLPVSEVILLVNQVAEALAVAQEENIVHRDIKPQNLFSCDSEDGRVWKVLDFGVSKIVQSANSLTHGAVVGTPGYMSPEQARGNDVDHRSDVFSLGAIAYRCLTGRPAFSSSSPAATMLLVVDKQPAKPSDLSNISEDVELVLAMALAKNPDERFGSAPIFAAALRDATRDELDKRLRDGGRALLSRHPWGQENIR